MRMSFLVTENNERNCEMESILKSDKSPNKKTLKLPRSDINPKNGRNRKQSLTTSFEFDESDHHNRNLSVINAERTWYYVVYLEH